MLRISTSFLRQSPRLASSFLRNSRSSALKLPWFMKPSPQSLRHSQVVFGTRYLTSGSQTPENPAEDAPKSVPPGEITAEMWLSLLEKTTSAQWLAEVPPDPEDRLRRSFTLLVQILLYLGRPQEPDAASQFLLAFESAPVSPASEIGRARRSTAILLRTVVRDILSIPVSSPLREQHRALFETHGALVPLSDLHLGSASGEVEEWRDFWPRAQPIVLELVEVLTSAGYGIDFEQLANEQNASKNEGSSGQS